MLRLGAEGGTSWKRADAGEDDRQDSEGEGTGSTELSDIKLLGRCEGRKKQSESVIIFYPL